MTPLAVILILGLAATGMGCASAGVTPVAGTADQSMLPRPSVVLVYDFAVRTDDVVIDTLGAEFQSEGKTLTEEEQIAYATADQLSVALVDALSESGINARRARDEDAPPLHAILLKGQFITIDKGSRIKRMVI
jgi:Tfp pilus assembly protein PilW